MDAEQLPNPYQRRHKVHHNHETNQQLTTEQRLSNIEHDILFNSSLLYTLIDKHEMYIDYVENAIEEEKEKREFWRDIRKKLVTAGLYTTMTLIGTAVLFYAKHWFKE